MIFRIGLLILLAAGVWALAQFAPQLRVPGTTAPAAPEPAQPGYYLRQAEMTEFGEDGHVRLRMTAVTAAQDTTTNTVHVNGVHLDYLALADQIWRLDARTGTVPRGEHRVLLQGDVVMTGTRGGRPERAVVHTDRLELDTLQHRATTVSPVSVSLGQYVLDARGLAADLKAGTLRLESSVNGRFLP
jgi:LPS export ABC transporter protein LptC